MRIHQTTPVYFYTKNTSTQPVHKNYTPPCIEIKDISNIYYPINFGYKHKLKNMWKDGLLKSVKYGLYGEILTKNNVSLEHIICHSNGGPTQDWNLALADKLKNSERGDKPLNKFLTKELAIQYLEQFRDIKINTNKYKFTGNDYIRKLAHNFKRNGINIIDNFKDLM